MLHEMYQHNQWNKKSHKPLIHANSGKFRWQQKSLVVNTFCWNFCLIGREIHLAEYSKLEQEQDQKGHKLMYFEREKNTLAILNT